MSRYRVGMTDSAKSAGFTSVQATQYVGPWEVVLTWPEGVTQGGPHSIEIRPRADATPEQLAGGLSSTVLRKISFGQASEEWREHSPAHSQGPRLNLQRHAGLLQDAFKSDGVSGPYLALLAEAYVALVSMGKSSVTTDLARLVGKSPETIRAHLKAARAHDLLTSVSGRAGGELTPAARQILEHENRSRRAQ